MSYMATTRVFLGGGIGYVDIPVPDASVGPYTPNDPTAWPVPEPTTVASALNDLAEGALISPWAQVNHAASPYSVESQLLPPRKFLVDCSAGPVQIDLTGVTLNDTEIILISDKLAQSSQNPITIKPPAGVSISDPNTPGTYRTNTGQLAAIAGSSMCVGWQYIASLSTLVAIVGV
jgi:hypothetical protein